MSAVQAAYNRDEIDRDEYEYQVDVAIDMARDEEMEREQEYWDERWAH